MTHIKKFLSTKELSLELNVPINTIYYWIAKNEIPHIKIGKHHRFCIDEVILFFKNKTSKEALKIKKDN